MRWTPVLLAALLTTLVAAPAASAVGNAEADTASCAGGSRQVVYWHVSILTGTCVGVDVSKDPGAPFTCRDESLPPCGLRFVVYA